MANAEEFPVDFAGTLRLFPLPDLVLFPHVVQPLRIFEPRYVSLLEDALANDRRVALGLLRPGWENDYEGRPAVFPVACLGRIVTHHRRPDRTYHVLLAGIARARIDEELPPELPYRMARAELLRDVYRDPLQQGSAHLRGRLVDSFRRLQGVGILDAASLKQDLLERLPLGTLADVISYAAPIGTKEKQTLLADPLVERRTAMLIGMLQSLNSPRADIVSSDFPPPFSENRARWRSSWW